MLSLTKTATRQPCSSIIKSMALICSALPAFTAIAVLNLLFPSFVASYQRDLLVFFPFLLFSSVVNLLRAYVIFGLQWIVPAFLPAYPKQLILSTYLQTTRAIDEVFGRPIWLLSIYLQVVSLNLVRRWVFLYRETIPPSSDTLEVVQPRSYCYNN